jgi:hypothetical protein
VWGDGVASKRRARIPAATRVTAATASAASSGVGTWRPTTRDSMKCSSTRWGSAPVISRQARAYILSWTLFFTRRAASLAVVTSLVL